MNERPLRGHVPAKSDLSGDPIYAAQDARQITLATGAASVGRAMGLFDWLDFRQQPSTPSSTDHKTCAASGCRRVRPREAAIREPHVARPDR